MSIPAQRQSTIRPRDDDCTGPAPAPISPSRLQPTHVKQYERMKGLGHLSFLQTHCAADVSLMFEGRGRQCSDRLSARWINI